MQGTIVDSFCEGSMPFVNSKIIQGLIKDFDDLNTNYIEKYMCTTTFCPCVKIQPSRWSKDAYSE
jgi:hypothetical protein